MSKIGEKLIPLLSELVKNIGCELVAEDPESDFIIFIDHHGRNLEIDIRPYGDSCRLVLAELERPYMERDKEEIELSHVLYEGEIHDPDSINRIKELIQLDVRCKSD